MNQYYKVTVKILTEDDNGKVKRISQPYIVHAVHPNDAVEKITQEFEGIDFEITNISLTKIVNVLQ